MVVAFWKKKKEEQWLLKLDKEYFVLIPNVNLV